MRLRSALIAGLFATHAAAAPLAAAELVMVERPGCHWCEQWNADIGTSYHKTEESARAPAPRPHRCVAR